MSPAHGSWLTGRERGVSSVLGFVLVLAIVIGGTVTVLSLGAASLDSTSDQSTTERAEHSMTLFDSRAAMVGLGTSSTQRVSFGPDGGSYEVENESGYIALYHYNYTKHGHEKKETLYNDSLGAFVYTNGDTEVAYQGGGVWKRYETGETRMVSPPEFHYREATLTLPLVRIGNNASATGATTAVVDRTADSVPVFPSSTTGSQNETGSPYNHDERPYQNPVENGTVFLKVHGDYYEGWANYFRQRTTGDVTVWHENETVRLDLVSFGGEPGVFGLPPDQDDGGGDQPIQALSEGHPITTYTLDLQAPSTGNNNFQSMEWSIFASNDNGDELEIHLSSNGKCKNSGWNNNKEIVLSLHYYNSSEKQLQQWSNGFDPSDGSVSVMSVDCSVDPGVLTVDLTDDDEDLEYTDIGNGNQWHFDTVGASANDSISPSQHAKDTASYSSGSTETVNWTVNHYMSRLGSDYELRVDDGPGSGEGSDRVDEDASEGELRYEVEDISQYIAFLHVTETEIEITFE